METKDGTETTKQVTLAEQIALLRRQRGGKKGSITKRINLIEDIMKVNGSRTRIRSLFESIFPVLKEAEEINQHLEELGDDTDDYMDDVKLHVDIIKSKIEE